MTDYDPSIIQKHADSLYNSANLVIVLLAVFGAIIGAAGFSFSGSSGFFAMTIGFGAGLASGLTIAANLKLRAQLALCQMSTEKHLRRLVSELPPRVHDQLEVQRETRDLLHMYVEHIAS